MSKSFTETRLNVLKQDREKLNKDYEKVAEKKRRESNPVEQNNLQLQLDSIAKQVKEIEEIEEKIQNIEKDAEDKKFQSLQEILSQFTTKEEILIVQQAYRACSPDVWTHVSTDKPEEILTDVLRMRPKHTRVEHFVVSLIARLNNSLLVARLNDWAMDIKEFDYLLNQEKEYLSQISKNKNSYLLIIIEKSNQNSANKNLDSYRIKAWFIPDIENYKCKNGNFKGCEQLDLSNNDVDKEKTFSSNDIQEQVKIFINQISQKDFYPEKFAIEIFLPSELLNHPVDGWQLGEEDEDFPPRIGELYKVVIRSYDRLLPNYRYKNFWIEKWDKLKDSHKISSLDDCFFSGNDNNANKVAKLKSLSNIIGLKVTTAPQKVGKGSIFAAILSSAIPVALWLRKDLTDLDCESEINKILKCDIQNLPEIIKDKRFQAEDPNTDIGHHISLLWDDPYRLPPDINYSM